MIYERILKDKDLFLNLIQNPSFIDKECNCFCSYLRHDPYNSIYNYCILFGIGLRTDSSTTARCGQCIESFEVGK